MSAQPAQPTQPAAQRRGAHRARRRVPGVLVAAAGLLVVLTAAVLVGVGLLVVNGMSDPVGVLVAAQTEPDETGTDPGSTDAPVDEQTGESAGDGAAAVRDGFDERAVAILRWWDARRAEAYAAADSEALAALYVEGAEVGAADVEVLEAYAARDLVITGVGFEVTAVVVEEESTTRMVVRVRDRLLRASVERRDGSPVAALPGTAESERLITFERQDERWLVRDIREAT